MFLKAQSLLHLLLSKSEQGYMLTYCFEVCKTPLSNQRRNRAELGSNLVFESMEDNIDQS